MQVTERFAAPQGGWTHAVPLLVLAGAMVILVVFLSRFAGWLLFWYDEWPFIYGRYALSPEALLAPWVDAFQAVPVLGYAALLSIVGLRSYVPYLAVEWILHLVAVALLYRVVSRRGGPWLGLVASISLLFLGSGWEVLLHPFQMTYLFAIVGGLAAVDFLDRDRRLPAAVALLVAIASSGIGVIYCGLIVVWGALRRDRGALLATMPAVLAYAWWFLTWGAQRADVGGGGVGVFDGAYAVAYGIGAAVAGLIGLNPDHWAVAGVWIGIGATVVLVLAIIGRFRPGPMAYAALAALLAEYVLQAALRARFGLEHGSRSGYIYPAAVFLWLAVAGSVGPPIARLSVRRPAWVVIAAVFVLAAVVPGNVSRLDAAGEYSRRLRATELAELRLIESLADDDRLVRDIEPDLANAPGVYVGPYLEAVARFGRPSLGWEWETEVDQAAVDAVRHKILAHAAS